MTELIKINGLKSQLKKSSIDASIFLPLLVVAIAAGFFGFLFYEISNLDIELPRGGW
ncbi:MAG: hypothetical protein ACXAC2_10530 [Candidatus Kariarchaeaceae archaeon]|jgi:hypothetical protein